RRMPALRPRHPSDGAARARTASSDPMTRPGKPPPPHPRTENFPMSKTSFIAALVGAVLVGAVLALVIAPQVVPPGLLPGIGAGTTTAAEQALAKQNRDPAPDDSAAVEAEKGEVIAVVNGANIYEADLSAFIQQLP